ncbi:hypothetical protein GGF43_000286 [Coemansia sp. RSA 2618]|nr:hypothetical protein GGF43_000286 [Coemansia sp. RSA 2618]
MVGPSFLTSSLKVVDPDSGNICAEVQFRPFELVRSLATWHIRGHKSYRYVCVGTAQFLEQSDSQSKLTQQAVGGRLVIYNLKPTKRKARAKATPLSPGAQQGASAQLGAVAPGFELKYVWESDRNGSVSALASLGDSYLVVAVDATCIVLKLDVVQKRLIECCECSLRFAATSLDVCGSDIVVGSKREAVNVLRFTPAASDGSCDVLELVHSARFGGNTADARFLASDLVAGVDHNGFLFVVGIPGNTAEFALDFVLGMHLGTECSRLRAGQLVQRLDAPEHVMSWSGSPNNVSGDNQDAIDYLLVSTISGAMWTLARISDDSFALLRCLELAMLDMPALHPARPLLAGNGSLNRARITSTLQSVGTIDGTFSTVFADNLTDVERAEVIRSSPELLRLALAIADRSKATFYSPEHGSDPTARAATAIARLISSLNSISVC